MMISKQRYEELIQMINIQSRQIDALIEMVTEARQQLNYVTSSYVDLVNILDMRYLNLPEKTRKTIEKIEELNKVRES